jgi:hypothetical protein
MPLVVLSLEIEGESLDQLPRLRRSTRVPQGFVVRPAQPEQCLQRGIP